MINICGGGFVASEGVIHWNGKFAKSALLPRKYQDPNLIDIRKDADILAPLSNTSVFINASGPTSIEESVKKPEKYLDQAAKQIEGHFKIFSEMDISPHYVFLSSAAVYGDTSLFPASEDCGMSPLSPYASGKVLGEEMLQTLGKSYGGKISILRVTSLFSDNLNSRVLGLIRSQITKNRKVELMGRESDIRDFMHVDQFFSILDNILQKSQSSNNLEIWNMGSGFNLSIKELVELAFQANNLENDYKFLNLGREFDPLGIQVTLDREMFSPIDTYGLIKSYFSVT